MSQKVSTLTIAHPSRHQLEINPFEILRLLLYGQSLQNGIACGGTQAPATLWLAKEHAHGERQFFFVSRTNEKTIRAMRWHHFPLRPDTCAGDKSSSPLTVTTYGMFSSWLRSIAA